MLKPEQIDSLREHFERIAEPINDFLIKDVIDRLIEAGEVTGTARNRAKIARLMRVSAEKVERYLKEKCDAVKADFNYWINEVAKLMLVQSAIPIELDDEVQQIVFGAIELADDAFRNLTQTLGMIDPYGNFMPLRNVYQDLTDYAFSKVLTGADTYQNAVQEVVKNLSQYGVQTIDYQSGRHDALDVAIRRNVFGGMGLFVEQLENVISQKMGADGWEISAHEASAEDHEPIQGRQYTNAEYTALNNSLKRRISTLNCKHIAFPIILGVSQPIYSEKELADMAKRNADGITYEGKHYTLYEATQMQRAIERNIRLQKRRIVAYTADGQSDRLQVAQTKYLQLEKKYREFSKVANMPTQEARLEVLGFTSKHYPR